MNARGLIATALLALAAAGPAGAGQERDPGGEVELLLAPGALLQGLVREEDVGLLFDHLRATLRAASEGHPAPPPPAALSRRGEEIAGELRARGTVVSLLVLDALERAARSALRGIDPPSGATAR